MKDQYKYANSSNDNPDDTNTQTAATTILIKNQYKYGNSSNDSNPDEGSVQILKQQQRQ